MKWNSVTLSHVGHVRSVNEDAVLTRPDLGVWAVADGMGGHEAGDIASQKVVSALSVVELNASLSGLVDSVEEAIALAHNDIQTYSAQQLAGRTMGCTLVVMVAAGRVGLCLWVGDSRLYRCRAGGLEQLSMDHTQAYELGLRQLPVTKAESKSNVITRAVGACDPLHVDALLFDVCEGDTFLLCTDGLTDEISDEDITKVLIQQDQSLQSQADRILETVLAGPARDNVSMVLVQHVPLSTEQARSVISVEEGTDEDSIKHEEQTALRCLVEQYQKGMLTQTEYRFARRQIIERCLEGGSFHSGQEKIDTRSAHIVTAQYPAQVLMHPSCFDKGRMPRWFVWVGLVCVSLVWVGLVCVSLAALIYSLL